MKNIFEQLSSVSINTELFNQFKAACIGKITRLKTLVEFSMKLYLVDAKFRERVDNHINGGNVSANKE